MLHSQITRTGSEPNSHPTPHAPGMYTTHQQQPAFQNVYATRQEARQYELPNIGTVFCTEQVAQSIMHSLRYAERQAQHTTQLLSKQATELQALTASQAQYEIYTQQQREQIQTQQGTINKLHQATIVLQSENEKLAKQNHTLQAQLAMQQKRNDEQQRQMEEQRNSILSTHAKLAQVSIQNDVLRAQLQQQKKVVKEKSLESEQLKQAHEKLATESAEESLIILALKKSLAQAQAKIEQFSATPTSAQSHQREESLGGVLIHAPSPAVLLSDDAVSFDMLKRRFSDFESRMSSQQAQLATDMRPRAGTDPESSSGSKPKI